MLKFFRIILFILNILVIIPKEIVYYSRKFAIILLLSN